MKIGIVLFENFTDLDFFLPWDLLNRVRLLGLSKDWSVEVLGEKKSYHSSAGLEILVSKPYSYANLCEGILFCSGPETRKLCIDPNFPSQFKLDPKKQVIAAVDSGSLILGGLGLLQGKKATTYPSASQHLAQFGATFEAMNFVEDANIATASRCLSGTRLALWMIERLSNAEWASKVYDSVKPLSYE